MPRSALLARTTRILAGLAATGALLAMPTAAEAKTFKAKFTDPKGDATTSARDIVSGRVAYNRRTGALSATVEVAGDWEQGDTNDILVVVISDLVGGKCRRQELAMAADLSDPAVPMAWRGLEPKRPRFGQGVVDGSVYKLRVKSKVLAGRTPGCVYLAIGPPNSTDDSDLRDYTAFDNGFR